MQKYPLLSGYLYFHGHRQGSLKEGKTGYNFPSKFIGPMETSLIEDSHIPALTHFYFTIIMHEKKTMHESNKLLDSRIWR